MILGIGSDIIDINRIEKTIKKFNSKFINRCFTKLEIAKCEKRLKTISSYAKRFAAKEALSKALGTGISKGICWKDIEVYNLYSGQPYFKLKGNALNRLDKISKKNCNTKINLTISDEQNLAYAMVIISCYEK